MKTMSATDAKNKIGDLWDLAANEPVTIERNGSPSFIVVPADKYVAIPCDEYKKLRDANKPPQRQIGFAKELLSGIDVNEILAVDLSDVMKDYI